MGFVFYDTETTGTITDYDQILQFAAIRTDHDLNELARFEIRCSLLPYAVPSPGAILVTGVSVEQLTDPSLPSHYEMVCAINEKLRSWSPAIFIGHNSLWFDEFLLRQAFYKTLHPLYLTNTENNCRSDSLKMVHAASMFAPDALTIPTDDLGKNVFKLDQLAPANGLDHADAHDALGDVVATVHLCRLIANRAPELWSNLIRFAQKAAVTDYVSFERVFCLSDVYFGRPYSSLVTSLGPNPEYGSQILALDLSFDPDELASLNGSALTARLAKSPKPVRAIRANASPILMPAEDAPKFAKTNALSADEIKRRADRLHADPPLVERLIAAYNDARVEKEPSVYVEEQIYDDFTGTTDQRILERFHTVDWPERAALLNKLADERLQQLGERLIYVERPESPSGDFMKDYRVFGS